MGYLFYIMASTNRASAIVSLKLVPGQEQKYQGGADPENREAYVQLITLS